MASAAHPTDFNPIERPVRSGGQEPPIGRRQVCDRRPARGSRRDLRWRPEDRQRDRALGQARLRIGRRQRADQHFRFGARRPEIATIEVSVGRDVGELSALLNAAIPGNEIHVRTVADKIILTGSVASAEEAQKALDIASGFVNDLTAPSTAGAGSVSISVGASGAGSSGPGASATGAGWKSDQFSDHPRARPGEPPE